MFFDSSVLFYKVELFEHKIWGFLPSLTCTQPPVSSRSRPSTSITSSTVSTTTESSSISSSTISMSVPPSSSRLLSSLPLSPSLLSEDPSKPWKCEKVDLTQDHTMTNLWPYIVYILIMTKETKDERWLTTINIAIFINEGLKNIIRMMLVMFWNSESWVGYTTIGFRWINLLIKDMCKNWFTNKWNRDARYVVSQYNI